MSGSPTIRVSAQLGRAASRPSLVVLSACLAQVIIVLDTTIVAVALPDAQLDLGFASADRQWAVTAYTLAFGSLLLVGGRVSTFLGAKRAFLIGAAGFGIASLLGGLANDFGTLIAFRALQGVFAALLAPTNLSLMNAAFPGAAGRSKAFAIFGSVAGAGAALGLVLGGALTELGDWRWCFFINVPLVAGTILVAINGLRGTAGRTSGSLLDDVTGLLLGTASVSALVFAFSCAESDGWTHSSTLVLLVGGAVLAIVFVIRERLAAEPLVPLSLLADARRSSSYLAIALVGFAQMGASVYLTFYLQEDLGYSPLRAGLAFLPMVVGLIVAAIVSTRFLVPRFGLGVVLTVGPLMQSIGFIWLSGLGTVDEYVSELVAPMVVIGMGLGTVMAPAMSSATVGLNPARGGLASALANTSQQLGASLGVAFLSTIATSIVSERIEAAAPLTQAEAATVRLSADVAAYSVGFQWLAGITALVAVLIAMRFALGRLVGGQ
ncbi:MFS transporter [Leucobacter chromiireducens]|nr:MFS transporter [Leucobacter chromiireducens]